MKRLILSTCICCLICIHASLYSQTKEASKDSAVNKEKSWKIFGSIYGGFYHKWPSTYSSQKSGFEFKTGILGFKNQFNEKVDATIMFDVSKTTRDIKNKYDTATISYTEGNNYTAYLKQADIHWKINQYAELSLGMLLSSQYLLTQDKFWDHRYIEYTFQESSKYGYPADFGARLKLYPTEKISVSMNMLNGDGPARWQDDHYTFLYAGDIEYRQSDNLIFRIYGDCKQAPHKSQKNQSVFDGFVGYVYKNIKIGGEFSFIHNVNFLSRNIQGWSAYAIYKFKKKFELLARYDFFQDVILYKNSQYLIAGIQYEPAKNYFLSVNFRNSQPISTPQLYINFGARF